MARKDPDEDGLSEAQREALAGGVPDAVARERYRKTMFRRVARGGRGERPEDALQRWNASVESFNAQAGGDTPRGGRR